MTRSSLSRVALALLCTALLTPATFAKKAGPAGKANKPGHVVRQYDANKDGRIDGQEIEAVKKAFAAEPNGPLKQFDANNDATLQDGEIAEIKKPVPKKDKSEKKIARKAAKQKARKGLKA